MPNEKPRSKDEKGWPETESGSLNFESRFDGLQLGSTSVHKREAIEDACRKLGIKAKIGESSVESKINAQPYGFDETLVGATNRAQQAQAENPRAVAIGIENGIIAIRDKFIDVAVIVVLTPDGKSFVGTSAGVEFPKEAVEIARSRGFKSTTAGSIIAETMGGSSTDPHATLTNGKVNRKEILTEAIAAALSRALFSQ